MDVIIATWPWGTLLGSERFLAHLESNQREIHTNYKAGCFIGQLAFNFKQFSCTGMINLQSKRAVGGAEIPHQSLSAPPVDRRTAIVASKAQDDGGMRVRTRGEPGQAERAKGWSGSPPRRITNSHQRQKSTPTRARCAHLVPLWYKAV